MVVPMAGSRRILSEVGMALRRRSRSLFALVRQRPGFAMFVDGDEGEHALGDLLRRLAPTTAAGPGLDLHLHRGLASLFERAVAAHLIPDRDGAEEAHGFDGDRHHPTLRALSREVAAGEVHLREGPAAEH